MTRRAETWPAEHVADHATAQGFISLRERSSYSGAPFAGFAQNATHSLILDGRIDNGRELAASLGLPSAGNAELALAAHARWGEAFASNLIGDFAIAVLAQDRAELTLARDAMGIRPLFVARTREFVAFASNMDVLLALPFVDRTPDHSWLVDFLEAIRTDATNTPYRGIAIMPPAHAARYGDGADRLVRHWSVPPLDTVLSITREEAVREYRRLFDQAVECRLPERGIAACELSGGLDSSSIAVTAARMLAERGGRLITLSHVNDPERSEGLPIAEEREEISSVLPILPEGTEHCWLDMSPESQLAVLAQTIARHGGPQRRDFSSGQPRLATIMEERDCRVLLSGHGGDECVTSHGAGYHESLAAAGAWHLLDRRVSWKARWLWRSAAGRAVLRARIMAAQRARIRSAPRFTLPTYKPDGEILASKYAFPNRPAWGTFAERERIVITGSHIAHRTQDCAVGSGPSGFAHAYPMLDTRLVDFVLRLPNLVKQDGERKRVLIRNAMEGRLPDRVRERTDKDGTIMPVALSGFHEGLDEFAALFARYADHPLVARLLDLKSLQADLGRYALADKSKNPFGNQQIRRAAQLCLWVEQQDRMK